MANIAEIVARLTLNAKDFTAKFDGAVDQAVTRARSGGAQIGRAFAETAGGGLRTFAAEVPIIGSALTGLSGAALVAGASVGSLALVLGNGITGLEDATNATRQLEAVLKATGNQTGFTADELQDFADSLENSLAVTAESVVKAEQVLATFDGVAGSTFKRAIVAASDLSAVYGGDLASNTEKLGITLQNLAQGNVEGLSKGFKFLGTETTNVIAALAKTGQTAEAQRALLDALEKTVGGSGEAAAGGLTGSFFRFRTALDNISEGIVAQSGLYTGTISFFDQLATQANAIADSFDRANKARGGAPGGGTGSIAFANDPFANLDKLASDRAATRAAEAAKAEGDKARAAAEAAASAARAATEQQRGAAAAEQAAKALDRQRVALSANLADLEFAARAAGMQADEAEKLTALRQRELTFGKLLTENDKVRITRAIELRQINEQGAAGDKAALDDLRRANEGYLDMLAKRGTDWIDNAAAAQKALVVQQREDFRFLSDSFYDIFSGRSGNIWSKFKELGARTLADLASQFVLGGTINIGGTTGGGLVGGLVNKVGGAISSSLLGSLGGAAGGVAGALGLTGLIGSTGAAATAGVSLAAATAAGVPGLAGVGAVGAIGGSGLAGAGAALAAAAPWLAAAAGLVALGVAVFGSKDPFSDAGLTTALDGVSVNSLRTRGKESAGKSQGLTDTVSATLSDLASAFGTTLVAGIRGGSIGTNNDQFYYNPTGGDFKAGGRMSFATAEEAAAAAVRDLVSKGALAGVDESVARLLSTGDLTTQTAKARLLAGALKEFSGGSDPTLAAVQALNAEFTQLRDIMAEAGSSAADVAKASALYDERLQAIKASSAGATSTLSAFLKDLGFGSASPLALGDQRTAALAEYAAATAAIGSKSFDQGAFVSAGQRLLEIETQISGRTQDFFATFSQVQADTNRAIAAINNASAISGENPFARKTADNTGITADNTALMAQGISALPAGIAAAFAQALAAAGFAGGFVGGDNRGFVAAA
jgi:hypothetical protein